MTDKHTLVEQLALKAAAWQSNCDGWLTSLQAIGQPASAETEAILRQDIYAEAATRITALEAMNAELARDRDTLMMFAKSIKTWREDADAMDRECGYEPRSYCEDVELMAASATNTLRSIRDRIHGHKAKQP